MWLLDRLRTGGSAVARPFGLWADSKARTPVTVGVLGFSAIELGSGFLDFVQGYVDHFAEEHHALAYTPNSVGFIPLFVLEAFNAPANWVGAWKEVAKYRKELSPESASLLAVSESARRSTGADVFGKTAGATSSSVAAVALGFTLFRTELAAKCASYNPILFSIATGLLAVAKACPAIGDYLAGTKTLAQAAKEAGKKATIVTLSFLALMAGLNNWFNSDEVKSALITGAGIGYLVDTAKEVAFDVYDKCVVRQERVAEIIADEDEVGGTPGDDASTAVVIGTGGGSVQATIGMTLGGGGEE